MRTLAVSTLTLVLTCGAAAQTVHVVNQAGGGGASFTTLGEAIAAAADGDFLLVRAGSYPEEVILDGKGLTVSAEEGHDVRVDRIVVRNLAPSQSASFRGVDWNGCCDVRLDLDDNRGPVWIEDATSPEGTFVWWGAEITGCDTVVLRSCVFGTPAGFGIALTPRAGMAVTNSEVALFECVVAGEADQHTILGGAAGMLVQDAQVDLYSSTVEGGTGGPEFLGFVATNGGPGIAMSGSSTVRSQGSSVEGGAGGWGNNFGPGAPGAKVVGGSLTTIPRATRTLATASPVRSSAPTSVTLQGQPDDRAYLLVAPGPGFLSTVGKVVGPLTVSPASPLLKLGRVPASGILSRTFPAPPVLAGVRSFYLQGVFINTSTVEITLGAPTQMHVLHPSF